MVLASKLHCAFCFDSVASKLGVGKKTTGSITLPNSEELIDGMFVTWSFTKDHKLRGCVGSLQTLKLGGLRDFAQHSAFEDSRFPPVSVDELPKLSVTVSILHSFEKCSYPEDWEVGTHGVIVKFREPGEFYDESATFLPEIAPENKWTKEHTLRSAIRKAGCTAPSDTKAMLRMVTSVVRYQSSKVSMGYDEYVAWSSGAGRK